MQWSKLVVPRTRPWKATSVCNKRENCLWISIFPDNFNEGQHPSIFEECNPQNIQKLWKHHVWKKSTETCIEPTTQQAIHVGMKSDALRWHMAVSQIPWQRNKGNWISIIQMVGNHISMTWGKNPQHFVIDHKVMNPWWLGKLPSDYGLQCDTIWRTSARSCSYPHQIQWKQFWTENYFNFRFGLHYFLIKNFRWHLSLTVHCIQM